MSSNKSGADLKDMLCNSNILLKCVFQRHRQKKGGTMQKNTNCFFAQVSKTINTVVFPLFFNNAL